MKTLVFLQPFSESLAESQAAPTEEGPTPIACYIANELDLGLRSGL